jgi:C4-dicarboxylate-specific signal transduction histidine kinase
VKWGLRLQLVVLLGALLLLFYAPLFFATSTYTRVGLEQLQRSNAEKLGRSVAAHLNVLRTQSSEDAFVDLARAQIQKESVHALSLLRADQRPLAILGEVDLLRGISRQSGFGGQPEVRQLSTPKGPAILVYEPGTAGGVAAVVRVDSEVTQAESLAKLMGLYMGVGGVALLAAAYLALTRWIVRPILTLERGAERVASGNLRLKPIQQAPRELANLSRQLSHMTERLAEEEESLRAKIEELESLTQELQDAQSSLVRSERLATVGRLAAGLAHEVGNPISALMGLQDLMLDGGLSESERKDFLGRMKKETARVDRVLSDLLAYARPGGDRRIASGGDSSGSVESAVLDVVSLLSPQGDMRDMAFEHEIDSDLPAVLLNQEELTQILLNLVMNAADACEKNGRVVIRAQKNEGGVLLTVEDNGPGVADEVSDSLFEPFVSTKDVGKGTGLGLAVTRGLVESAGGGMQVAPSELGGAKFSAQLPLATQAGS